MIVALSFAALFFAAAVDGFRCGSPEAGFFALLFALALCAAAFGA